MHIPEGGVISTEIMVTGWAVTGCGLGLGLRNMDDEMIPAAAVLSSAFFVASLIHVPTGVSSVHLVLNGLAGIVLGWTAFPVIFIGLLLQAVLFGFGGITVLGVNTAAMALPAVLCGRLFRVFARTENAVLFTAAGVVCGAGSIFFSALLVFLFLLASRYEYLAPALVFLSLYAWVMIAEGVINGFIVVFLRKVCPELLDLSLKGEKHA
mgnify:CR=1 FL=1